MTEEEQREAARKEKYRRYNSSTKGAARYKKYEDKHPERAERWSPILVQRTGYRRPYDEAEAG